MKQKQQVWILGACIVLICLGVIFYVVINRSTLDWVTVTDNVAVYKIKLPVGTEFCVPSDYEGGDCEQRISRETTKIDGAFYIMLKEDKGVRRLDLEVDRSPNALNMSAIDFAKRTLKLSQDDGRGSDYSDAKEIVFAGIPAYSFKATGGFEEYGRAYGRGGSIDAPEFYDHPGESRVLEGEYYVIYFDYDGMIFRLLYPNDDMVKQAIASLEFVKK